VTALYTALPLWVVLTSLVAALVIFALGEKRSRARVIVNLIATVLKVVLVSILLVGVYLGHDFGFRVQLLPGIDFVLHADALTILLSTLSALLWLITTIYAIGYLEDSPNRCRFFGFFSLCVAATMGVAAAGNLFTFFLFYELLTLATWPLVVHRGTTESLRSGALYLAYTLGGGALLLVGIIALQVVGGTTAFVAGGSLPPGSASAGVLSGIFLLLFIGMAVKAAVVPLHSWLPKAMVAPAPVSALLHAVAVVKAGAFGIVRLVQDVFGHDLTAFLGMHHVVAITAGITILYGSIRALGADDLKQRLAWSTVSQVSYIGLGIGIGGHLALVGGLVHLVHQGLMKITLFFCAGNLAETHEIKKVSQMDGAGRRMPWTMAAFTLGALGMIGLPPLAGFITKWYLATGGIETGQYWVVGVLIASTLLNAAYFLPILARAWMREPPAGAASGEALPTLLWPALIAALFAGGAGFLAGMPWSPLYWVEFISELYLR